MIQKETYLEVADNSGAKLLQCIHVIGSTGKRFARLGDTIKCAVKKAIPKAAIIKIAEDAFLETIIIKIAAEKAIQFN